MALHDDPPDPPEDWTDDSSGRYQYLRAEGSGSGTQELPRVRKGSALQLVETLLGQLESEFVRRMAAVESHVKELEHSSRTSDEFVRQALLEVFNRLGKNSRDLRSLSEILERQERVLRTLVDRIGNSPASRPPPEPITADLVGFEILDEREG